MSEYIEIEADIGDGGEIVFHTNLRLTAAERAENYESIAALEEGSPVAQALSGVAGIATLAMENSRITITTLPDADWHALIADVTAALKDFFL